MTNYSDNEVDEKLVLRAISAYFKFGGSDMPSNNSRMEEVKGKRYAVLNNAKGILAVYRIRNDGKLKSLKRYPKELENK